MWALQGGLALTGHPHVSCARLSSSVLSTEWDAPTPYMVVVDRYKQSGTMWCTCQIHLSGWNASTLNLTGVVWC